MGITRKYKLYDVDTLNTYRHNICSYESVSDPWNFVVSN